MTFWGLSRVLHVKNFVFFKLIFSCMVNHSYPFHKKTFFALYNLKLLMTVAEMIAIKSTAIERLVMKLKII